MVRFMSLGCVVLTILVTVGAGTVQAQRGNGQQAGNQMAQRKQMQARNGGQGQMQARNGGQGQNEARNGAQRNQGVQMLLQRFDANGNGSLEGNELVNLATAIQQMMAMAGMGQQARGMGGMQNGMQNGMGQDCGNQGAMGRGNAQGLGQAAQQGFGHGGGRGGAGGGGGGGGARGGGR